jgi:hypothetical protein
VKEADAAHRTRIGIMFVCVRFYWNLVRRKQNVKIVHEHGVRSLVFDKNFFSLCIFTWYFLTIKLNYVRFQFIALERFKTYREKKRPLKFHTFTASLYVIARTNEIEGKICMPSCVQSDTAVSVQREFDF